MSNLDWDASAIDVAAMFPVSVANVNFTIRA